MTLWRRLGIALGLVGELTPSWWKDFDRRSMRIDDREARRWNWESWNKKW